MTHFFYCPFTGLGLHNGFRGNTWLKGRIQVFMQFVLPSLIAQTNKDCLLWVSWRPEESTNKFVLDFYKRLSQVRGLKTVFTFEGLCFFDDKYPLEEGDKRLSIALSKTLPLLRPFVGGDHVLMTIQPSDDMYLSNVVQTLQDYPYAKGRAIGFKRGYIMDYSTKEVAEYTPDTTPPFFTLMFPAETFLDPEQHFLYTGPYQSHEYLKDHLDLQLLDERGFVVGTHGGNISTVYQHPYRGAILTSDQRDDILINTGTYFASTYTKRKGMHLYARNVLNRLPFEKHIRKLYHSLH